MLRLNDTEKLQEIKNYLSPLTEYQISILVADYTQSIMFNTNTCLIFHTNKK